MIANIAFSPGDTVKVHQRIKEGEKTRIQIFKGTVLQIKGRGKNKMFTVQKIVGQIGVERIWSVDSPAIEKVDVEKARKRARRAKLYNLRIPKA